MGILVALFIFIAWSTHLYFILNYVDVTFDSIQTYLHILLQTYFYTGLFITAHDAMHGTVSKNKFINKSIGTFATLLYAGMSYNRMIVNHFKHHKLPCTGSDPDFNISTQNFFIWWGTFLFRYTTIAQILIMAILFNVLKLWIAEISIWMFWVLPAVFSSLQLFFFGTYLPHRKPHEQSMEPHKARSQKKNHFWAMISCYFFGYHFEHHSAPHIPWWNLYKLK